MATKGKADVILARFTRGSLPGSLAPPVVEAELRLKERVTCSRRAVGASQDRALRCSLAGCSCLCVKRATPHLSDGVCLAFGRRARRNFTSSK